MKILVICQYYHPEPFRISDICEEFVKQGHEVLVVTGVPNYPEGVTYDKYKYGKNRDEVINGVRVHRCFTVARKKGAMFRFLNYYSYSIFAKLYTSFLREKFDVVFVNQLSPVMMAEAAASYKKRHGTGIVLYCLDLWPESLTMGGIRKGSALYKYYHWVSEKIYKQADRILISSNSFSKYFEEEFGIFKTAYLPQYSEELFDPESCKKEPNRTIDFMFAGNVGVAQSLETVVYAAEKTKEIPNLRWHIVGDGSELTRIQALSCELGLKNVIFHGRQPLERMTEYYSMADAMLVTMRKGDMLSMTLPGKVQTYMAAGKPIIGAVDGETASVIFDSKCGLCCEAEDAEGLANIAKHYVQNHTAQCYGEHARQYYENMFLKTVGMEKLLRFLDEVR